MTKNELSLEVSDACNPKVMRVFDTSNYCEDVLPNYMVEVLPVNKSKWVVFYVNKQFTLTLNSSNLGYKAVNDVSKLIDVPDGIYEFKQSYKPNLHTSTKFYHLRTVEVRRKLKHQWDKLVDNSCRISQADFFVNRDRLRDIIEYVDAATWKVEECHDKKKGKELYDFSSKLLEQYTNECQC